MEAWIILTALCLCFSNVDSGSLYMPVYTQARTIDTYLYKEGLPAMSENTICFWMNTGTDDDARSSDHFISIATTSDDNEYLAHWSSTAVQLYIWGGPSTVIETSEAEMNSLWIGWHKHCLVWTAGGDFSWYVDRTTPGEVELIGSSVMSNSNSLRSGGVVVLMQEQDSYLGGFNINQGVEGKIAWFNMWNYEMDLSQLQSLKCRDVGNVVTWDQLTLEGNSIFHYERFPCNDNEMDLLPKLYTEKKRNMIFCKIVGASLANHDTSTSVVTNHRRCLALCIGSENCISANYRVSTKSCTLNDSIDQDYASDFTSDMSEDYLHFTSRECAD